MQPEPFIIERVLNASVATVWQAITGNEQMKQWYFDLPGFTTQPGYTFTFKGGPPDKIYVHLCRVTEVIPNKKLCYTWRYEGYEGDSLVSFELFEEGAQTRLRLTHSGLETFPAANPDLAKHNFVAGWTDIIGRSLPEFLEKA